MRAWAESIEGSLKSGVKFIADGNGSFVKALQLSKGFF
jgi:peroxiredoxin